MKKLLYLPLLFLITASCSKDKTPEPVIVVPAANVCDSIPKTFSSDVQPIFQTYCVSCHSGSTPSAGYKLVDHNDISSNITISLEAIKHQAGVTAMPYFQPALSDSLIQVIECWVADGTPNN